MEEEGEGKTAVDCTSVLRSVLRKGTFRLVIVDRCIIAVIVSIIKKDDRRL